jgi:hypothetical protein
MRRFKTLFGKLRKNNTYDEVSLQNIIGQTVEAVRIGEVDGGYGPEPCTMLYFTNNTRHGFVHPREEDR